MNYTKHFINNYRILKGRMIEKNKGFWKVQKNNRAAEYRKSYGA